MTTSTTMVSVEDGVGRIVLSNPPLNILTRETLGEVRGAMVQLQEDSAARVVVLAADGKHFSAGADVGEHLPPHFEQLIPEFLGTVRAVYDCSLPVVVAVQGRCLGAGFELAMAGDIIIAAEGASFGQPEIVLGVSPPAACVLLPEITAPGVAAELVLGGDPIAAAEAERLGIVRRVVPDAELAHAATDTAQRIARHSRAALQCTKRTLRAGAVERISDALDRARGIYVDELMQTADALEGLQAFLEKRRPTWSHR